MLDSLIIQNYRNLVGIESLHLQRYKHRPKAFVHTWLAWQEDSGMPMGRSISDYNLVDTKTAAPFANWLQRLFPPEPTER